MKLDIGCGPKKPKGYVGMDRREMDGVDVVHDWSELPWPFDDGEFAELRASHVIEHICPLHIIEWMDEAWRVLEPGGKLVIGMPHAWSSGDAQDPTHCLHASVTTWEYFDPDYELYAVYAPRPWRLESAVHNGPNLDAVLVKREAK